MPLAAPVMTQTLPLTCMFGFPLFLFLERGSRVIRAALRGQCRFALAINFLPASRAPLVSASPACDDGRAGQSGSGELKDARSAGWIGCDGAACGRSGVDERGGLVALPDAVQRSVVRGAIRSPPAFRSQ